MGCSEYSDFFPTWKEPSDRESPFHVTHGGGYLAICHLLGGVPRDVCVIRILFRNRAGLTRSGRRGQGVDSQTGGGGALFTHKKYDSHPDMDEE